MSFSRIEGLRVGVSLWWDEHGGWRGVMSEVAGAVFGPLQRTWWRFGHWRRSRDPELVELDAFRELVHLERKLKDFPQAVPLLEAALKAYATTGQNDKKRDIVRRLREADPTSRCLGAGEDAAAKASPEIEGLVARAVALVQRGERASVSNLQRKLVIGYGQAVQVCDILEERGLAENSGR